MAGAHQHQADLLDGSHAILVVDLDGTLTPTDTLIESLLQMAKQHPGELWRLPISLLAGRAAFKHRVSQLGGLDVSLLPWNVELLDYLRLEHARGRRIVLATAAHQRIAEAVFRHLGFFDELLCTDAMVNLKGRNKLQAIRERVGNNFIYVGDSAADLEVWRGAVGAVIVGASAATTAAARTLTTIEREFFRPMIGALDWLRLLRLHQWLKNILIFIPLLTAFSFLDPGKWLAAILAFLAFSIAASASYILNDLWDLQSDRAHPRKKLRPLASARIAIPQAVALSVALLGLAVWLASLVSMGFLGVLLVYLALTTSYSWVLKNYVLLDVLMLATLYTLRIIAGSWAIHVETSSWLLAFSMFIFLSLALVKRCAELVVHEKLGQGATNGRDYRVGDLVVLWPLGIGAFLASVVVFGLFISAPDTTQRYAAPQLLWLVAVALIYWLARLWIKTARGEMHDDPLVYAIKDFGSRATITVMLSTVLLARFMPL